MKEIIEYLYIDFGMIRVYYDFILTDRTEIRLFLDTQLLDFIEEVNIICVKNDL
jgi:hypothetical protein